MRKAFYVWVIIVGFCACVHAWNRYGYWQRQTEYLIGPDTETPGGISVDTSGFAVDLDKIDHEATELEQCLGVTLDRRLFVVKVAPDWYESPCTGAQVFPCEQSKVACVSKITKGVLQLLPTSPCTLQQLLEDDCHQCPCACRRATQPIAGGNALVVTPDLVLLRAILAQLVTGVSNPWLVPRIAQCL